MVNRKNPRSWTAGRRSTRVRSKASTPVILIALMLASAVGVGFTAADTPVLPGGFGAMLPGSGCNVKGNISRNTGVRIYHVPGQKYYHETRISMMYGERWFCSEEEARRAGWRKSRV